MIEDIYRKMASMAQTPKGQQSATDYLVAHMKTFLKKKERVLILFDRDEGKIGQLMETAVVRCGGIPVFWGEDKRWHTLLRTAFLTRCNAIIGPPLTILGLAKVAKYLRTPLFARNVVLAGYPSTEWMIQGIQQGLDSKVWGCYDPGAGSLVVGFSCDKSYGVHLRSDVYTVEIMNKEGSVQPDGESGDVVIYPNTNPELRFYYGGRGYLETAPCECGNCSPRLMGIDNRRSEDHCLSELGEQLHRWTSILDCRLENTQCGLEIELITFPGEKLPKLPSCARMIIRNWVPEKDEPFPHMEYLRNQLFSLENR